eukprot:5506221-Amphidinium_carterae.3
MAAKKQRKRRGQRTGGTTVRRTKLKKEEDDVPSRGSRRPSDRGKNQSKKSRQGGSDKRLGDGAEAAKPRKSDKPEGERCQEVPRRGASNQAQTQTAVQWTAYSGKWNRALTVSLKSSSKRQRKLRSEMQRNDVRPEPQDEVRPLEVLTHQHLSNASGNQA